MEPNINNRAQEVSELTHIHEVVLPPQQFKSSIGIVQTTEIREDDGRFAAGDFLLLREYENDRYTGREIMHRIISLTNHEPSPGYALLTVELVPKSFSLYRKMSYKEKAIFKEAVTAVHHNMHLGSQVDFSLQKILTTLLNGERLRISDTYWYMDFWEEVYKGAAGTAIAAN